jgi:mono/diheme cytochrome c family protein
MKPLVRGMAVAAAVLAVVAALVPAAVYLGSEALIIRRYTLPSSIVHAAGKKSDIAWGEHVATIYGCRDCHGMDATGRMLRVPPGLTIPAPNLRRFVAGNPDSHFDWAVRHGLAPTARALWVMPSPSYVYMRDSDLEAILAWLYAQPPRGPQWPDPYFDLLARLAVLTGSLTPVDPYNLGRHPPRDVGPRYDGGRYIAAMSCASCHGTDLTGSATAPDLDVAGRYSRAQFFALIRDGVAPGGRRTPQMAGLPSRRFHAFKDYEIDALYAYLKERARTAPAP